MTRLTTRVVPPKVKTDTTQVNRYFKDLHNNCKTSEDFIIYCVQVHKMTESEARTCLKNTNSMYKH